MVGEEQVVLVAVDVRNEPSVDPAYLARVTLSVPASVQVVNMDRCTVQEDENAVREEVLVVCDAGNSLRPSQAVRVEFLSPFTGLSKVSLLKSNKTLNKRQ